MVNKLYQIIRWDYDGEKFTEQEVAKWFYKEAAAMSRDCFTSTTKKYTVIGKGGEISLWPKFTVS